MSETIIELVSQESKKLDAVGNVIFVHGLDGDYKKSWTNKKNGEFWPSWLAEEVSQLNVWTLGYDVASSGWRGSALPVQARANSILERLATTPGIADKPICFVTHSMGGLVVKQLLNNADTQNYEKYRKIGANVRGVVFIATPHDGAGLASLLNTIFPKTLFRPNVSVTQLENTNPTVMNLKDWYSNNSRRLNIKTLAFYETRPFGPVIVVNQASARPGIEGLLPIAIEENHIDICKPFSKNSQLFLSTRDFIKETLLTTPPQTIEKPATPVEKQALPPDKPAQTLPNITPDEKATLESQLKMHRRTLSILEDQIAAHGELNAPPVMLNQRKITKEEIAKLERKLGLNP